MDAGSPPVGGDQNMAGELLSFTWILCIAALIFTLLRGYTRLRLTRNLWWDDWSIFFTMVCSVIFSIFWTIYAVNGYARHAFYLSPHAISEAVKISWVSQSFCILSIASGKVSVAFLIQRIQAPCRWRTWLLWFISISVSVSGVIAVILVYLQCTPYYALWNPQLVAAGTAQCRLQIAVNNYDIVVASYYSALDFLLALVLVSLIWGLQINLRRKLVIGGLLSCGIIAGVFAALKTSRLRTLTAKSDITWITVEVYLWNALEINLIIIAACIPTLRPLFLVVFNKAGASEYVKQNPRNSIPLRAANSSGECARSDGKFSDGSTAVGSHDTHSQNREAPPKQSSEQDDGSRKNLVVAGDIRKTIHVDIAYDDPRYIYAQNRV